MARSQYLASLTPEQRQDLERRLHERQTGRCFICDDAIDPVLHKGQLEIDHIDPLRDDGLDAENNFALTHAVCNRRKGASNLQVARRLTEFDRLQERAREDGKRGANLGDVLGTHQGAMQHLRLVCQNGQARYSFAEVGRTEVNQAPILHDKLSGMRSFFGVFPIEYLHHDDTINPRSIGNIRPLLEEFQKRNPQLHVALGWWAPSDDGAGQVRVFDGQHKAAAQILLGVRELPVRVFVEPDTDILLRTNTNAGGKLRQVAFDPAVMRHLGSTIYVERLKTYRQLRDLEEDDYSFSERDLVRFFKGESREMERFIVDAQRDAVNSETGNKLREFVEWSGKGSNRPLPYMSIERSFYKELLYKKALESPLGEGIEQGTNPRQLEREQLVRIMNLFADVFFAGSWDPDVGGYRIENRLQSGQKIPPEHLRAWRISRDEVLGNVIGWLRLSIENYFALTGQMYDRDRLLHKELPQPLWQCIQNFLRSVANLPLWSDTTLSNIVFGPKQNRQFWKQAFETGKTPTDIRVLAEPFDLKQMVSPP